MSDAVLRGEMDGKIQASLTAAYRPKVKLLLPDEVRAYLAEAGAAMPTKGDCEAGYRVKVTWRHASNELELRHTVRELLTEIESPAGRR